MQKLIALTLTFCTLLATPQALSAQNRYANPNLLVEVNWVEERLKAPNIRIVDMRDEKAYKEAHMPGAVHIEEAGLRNAEERLTYLPKPETFTEMVSKAGINNKTHVLIYDAEGGKMAARLWYVLNAFGHKRVSLINGGWQRWVAEKYPTTAEVPNITPASFKVKEYPDMTCPLPTLLNRKPDIVVLDTRSEKEFRGQTLSPGAKQAGRIPGAVNVDWKDNVEGSFMEFKSGADLMAMYITRGINPDKEIVVYCASGGRASQTLFTLKLIGYKRVKVYYGSFRDYSALENAPIEK
jgi:thiosulfate/3-mercaptopyruvate sulfurtransferase